MPYILFKSITQLKKKYSTFLKKGQFKGLLQFRRPEKDDLTIINDYPVIIRDKPNIKSRKLAFLSVHDPITILSVGKKKSLKKWGTYRWYQVKTDTGTKGWVFGVFLEPVEAKLK